MSSDSTTSGSVDQSLRSLRFVGPSTAAVLRREGYDATAITDKRVSYRRLIEAGVNPGVAAKIRREHSLSWSFRSGGDLDRRSAQIRGLGRAEAEWVAASTGDWEQTTEPAIDIDDESTDSQTPTDDADRRTPWPTHGKPSSHDSTTNEEAAWRARSTPTPVTELAALDSTAVDQLAKAGIISVRSLATVDVERVADVLEISELVVERWYQAARAAEDR